MAVNLNKDAVYRAAKAKDKDYFINDGGGLNLVVGKNGAKLWRFIYTFAGKRKKLALGAYPIISLEIARRKTEEARDQLAKGIDPSEIKKEVKAAINVEAVLRRSRIYAGLSQFCLKSLKWRNSSLCPL